MATPKYAEILQNPYTGEIKEITASKEDVFLRKRQEQLEKWEHQEYIRQKQQEARCLNRQLLDIYKYLNSLCYVDLRPLSTKEFYNENVSNIHRVQIHEPTLEEAEKDVGINFISIWRGILSSKYDQKLQDLNKKAHQLYNERHKEYELQTKKEEAEYKQRKKEKEIKYNDLISSLSEGDIVASENYFAYAIHRDSYCVDAKKRYIPELAEIKFEPGSGEIRLSYRIPNTEEIPCIEKYTYNEKTNVIEACSYDEKISAKWRLKIAESVLLRLATLIFKSDEFDKVKNVSIIGYICFFDSAFGCLQTKNVIQFSISHDLFSRIILEAVSPIDLFSRVIKANISANLYLKEPFEIKEIE